MYSLRWFWLIVAGSALYTLVVFNRWITTDLGLASFGRVWHYAISYWDLGFTRRLLAGTVLVSLGLDFSDEYLRAYVIYLLHIVALYALLAYVFLRHRLAGNLPLVAVVFLSPALLLQIGYLTGSQDATLLLLAMVTVFLVRSPLLLGGVLVAGVLVHEMFVFYVPGALVLKWLNGQKNATVVGGGAAAIALVSVGLLGRLDMTEAQFESLMLARLPKAAYVHPLWSGYFELAGGLRDNWAHMQRFLGENVQNVGFLAIPLAYCLVVAWAAASARQKPLDRLLLAGACLAPLCITPIATDVYRWIGMAANVGLLALVYSAAGSQTIPQGSLLALLPFSLFAPFGSYPWDRPFPLHQFVIERYCN